MSEAGVRAAEAMALATEEIASSLFTNWFTPPGAYSIKNCDVIACKSCGSETSVLKRHYAVGYTCPRCIQANSYA